MKKKILTAALLSLSVLSVNVANAKPLICPFTDTFLISAPEGYYISALSSEGNVRAILNDLNTFKTSCADNTNSLSGYAYVSVSNKNGSMCNLEILDGPFEMNPVVTSYVCDGKLKYAGVKHDWGTYTYKLQFVEF